MGMPVPAFARPPALNPMPALPVPKKSERANARNARAKIPVPGQPAGTNGQSQKPSINNKMSFSKYHCFQFYCYQARALCCAYKMMLFRCKQSSQEFSGALGSSQEPSRTLMSSHEGLSGALLGALRSSQWLFGDLRSS